MNSIDVKGRSIGSCIFGTSPISRNAQLKYCRISFIV